MFFRFFQMFVDDYDMFIGNILSVRDVTRNEQTGVDLAVELTINWAVGDAINFVYGMHPAISWRNMADGKVHHKMVGDFIINYAH